jgi:hypothetical protein
VASPEGVRKQFFFEKKNQKTFIFRRLVLDCRGVEGALWSRMLKDEDVERIAFDAVAAQLAPGKLKRVDVKPFINSVNEEGLQLTIVVSDDNPPMRNGKTVVAIMVGASDRLAEAGETRDPTFRFATESELAHSGDPDT